MSTATPPLFRFNERERGLWLGSEAVAVPPKSLALLHALLQHAGTLVTREELLRSAWPGVQVTADAVRYSMRQLRLALQDSASEPVFIETLPKAGWRFIGQAVRVADGTWRIAARGADAPELRAPSQAVAPAGRVRELGILREALSLAHAGQRQLMFVSGDAGIGKTTLLESFVSSLDASSDVVVGRGQCVEDHGGGEAYLPIFEALERLCQQPQMVGAIDGLRRYAPSWLAQMPALTEPEEREVLRLQTQGGTQGRMIRELSLGLEALSVERTLVLWIDDLHWSDVSTLEFLTRCMLRPEPARLLLIASHRPMDRREAGAAFSTLHRELANHGASHDLAVPFLSEVEVLEYVAGNLGRPDSGENLESLARFIWQRTEGHPLFMVSLLGEFVRRGIVERAEPGWRLSESLEPELVPRTLEQLLADGLDGIDSAEREILEIASVIGMRVSAAAIAATTDAGIEEVEAVCDALARRERYFIERDPELRPDGTVSASFEFRHALHRELFASTVPDARRARWHRQVGDDKAAAWAGQLEAVAAELAQHFAEARDAARASEYFAISGEASARMSSNVEAVEQLRRALEWTERLPESPERGFRELAQRLSLSAPLASTLGYAAPELAQNLLRIEALAENAGESPAFQPVLLGLWSLYLVRGELPTATEVSERLVRLATPEADPLALLQAHRTLGFCRFFVGRLVDADRHLALGRDGYDIGDHQRLDYSIGDDPVVLVHSYEAWVAWFRGDPDRAASAAASAVEWAQRLEHPPSLAFSLGFAGVTHHLRGDVEETLRAADDLLELAEADGMAMWLALGQILRGWARSQPPEIHDDAIDEMRAGLAAWEATGSELGRPYFLCMVADALVKASLLDAAAALVPQAEEAIRSSGQTLFAAEVHRVAGEIAKHRGADMSLATASFRRAATASFRRAISEAQEAEAAGLELRSALSLFDALAVEGGAPEAVALVSEALSRCTRSNHDRDQQRARKYLER